MRTAARVEELVCTPLVEVGDGQVLGRHPARQAGDDPQLVPNRRAPIAGVGEPRAERIEVGAEDAGPQLLRGGGNDKEVFQHVSPPCPAASPGRGDTSRIIPRPPEAARPAARSGLPPCRRVVPSRDNPAVGIMADVVDSREPSIGRADPGRRQEHAEALAEAVAGIRAAAVIAIPQQGEFSGHRQMATPARLEIRLKLAHGVGGEGQHARLVKLALPDEDRAVTWVVVGDRQAQKFSSAQTRRVEQDEGQPKHVGPQGEPGVRASVRVARRSRAISPSVKM